MGHFPIALRLLAGAALSILVPVALYHGVEHPCIQLGSRSASRFRRA
jgi:peptidoglycan/LPS O-acetylase OafA/YrhL